MIDQTGVWVVLGETSDQKAQVFGLFMDEDSADSWARRMNKRVAHVDFTAHPVYNQITATGVARALNSAGGLYS